MGIDNHNDCDKEAGCYTSVIGAFLRQPCTRDCRTRPEPLLALAPRSMRSELVLSKYSLGSCGRLLAWGSVPPLLTFLLVVVSGWVHRQQLIVIEYLRAENRLLKERLRGKRIRFTDAERTLLARKAKTVRRKVLLKPS